MSYFQAIIISIVQGLTEFLPVSSTGHMIIAQSLMGMKTSDFIDVFAVSIHMGTALAVIILYWKRFFQSITLYYKLFIAFIPAAIAGFLLDDYIGMIMGSDWAVWVVAISLLAGGVILLFVDKWFVEKEDDKNISYSSSFKIGLFQVIAMIPGISRSAATIVGGMTQKLSRKQAAEFSFLLAVPTILAASGYKLLKNYKLITTDTMSIILVGNIIAFIVAIIAIKAFIGFLQKYGFKGFGYYRIILALILIIVLSLGYNLEIGLD